MADATQVKIRRDTASNMASTTPVEAELFYDQTNKRLGIGDGTLVGGIPHQSYNDARVGTFNRGTVGGSANAITITMSPANTSYASFLKVGFLATATNTGAVQVNIDSLGNVDLQKVAGGSFVPLVAGDIVNGVYYEIIRVGSIFQIVGGVGGAGASSVGQGQLKTSSGTISASAFSADGLLYYGLPIAGPGGEYGFSIDSRLDSGGGVTAAGWLNATSSSSYTQYFTPFSIGLGATISGRQRYITSSPPYDLGDGEVGGFLFFLVNSSGDVVAHYAADSPPWAYNGPTCIRAEEQCPVSGKKYNYVRKKRTLEEVMDGKPLRYERREITHEVKNKDMALIPHPFGNVPEDHHVILIDPMDVRIRSMIDFQNSGGAEEVIDEILAGKFILGDECSRCGPAGVHVHKLRYKYTEKF